jgi:hypothetical protein
MLLFLTGSDSNPSLQKDDMTTSTPTTSSYSSSRGARFQHQESCSSEWSDPRQDNGVLIPAFMQPLFGLDFIPYLPPREVSPTPSDRSDHGEGVEVEYLTENDESDPDLLIVDTTLDASPCRDADYFLDTPSRKPSKSLGSAIRRALQLKRGGRRRTSSESDARDTEGFQNSAKPSRRGRRRLPPGKSTPSNKNEVKDDGDSRLQQEELVLQTLNRHQKQLDQVQTESVEVQKRANLLTTRVSELQAELERLHQALKCSMVKLREEASSLEETKDRLASLEAQAVQSGENIEMSNQLLLRNNKDTTAKHSSGDNVSNNRDMVKPVSFSFEGDAVRGTTSVLAGNNPLESSLSSSGSLESLEAPCSSSTNSPRAHTEPRAFCRSSSSFMRVQDLEMSTSQRSSVHSAPSSPTIDNSSGEFFFIDHDVSLVLERLFQLDYKVVTDETNRFDPTRDTARLLQKNHSLSKEPLPGWPVHPWHVASDDIYMWTGAVPHKGFGHDWPVVKARTVVRSSPRALLDFFLDSSQIKKYNKMCQGREEVLVLQKGFETTADESQYGIAGDVRILRILNKPKLLNKTIEVLSVWYSKPLENAPGSYMTVNRSVFEDDSGRHKASDEDRMLRSEMVLGVTLLRPTPNGHCEMTTITRVFSPGVPEIMAKRFAPGTSATMLRDIQKVFA